VTTKPDHTQERWLARPLGVYKAAVVLWMDAQPSAAPPLKVRAYIWSERGQRWTKQPSWSYVYEPPRMTREEAEADWRKHYRSRSWGGVARRPERAANLGPHPQD
jgi:hypothetical protein